MINFSDWLLQRESRASTRSKHNAAQGLLPIATIGSPDGHSTASPYEDKQIKKAIKKKKFRAHSGHRKIGPKFKNTGIDTWLKEVDTLKLAVEKLKAIFDSKKKDKQEKDVEKPEKPPEESNKSEKIEKTVKEKNKTESKKPKESV